MGGEYLRSLFSWLELGETRLFPEKSVELISRNRGSLPIYDSWGRESDEFQVDISPFLTGWVGKVMYFRLDASSFSGVLSSKVTNFSSLPVHLLGLMCALIRLSAGNWGVFRGIIRRSCALLFLSWWIARMYVYMHRYALLHVLDARDNYRVGDSTRFLTFPFIYTSYMCRV